MHVCITILPFSNKETKFYFILMFMYAFVPTSKCVYALMGHAMVYIWRSEKDLCEILLHHLGT